MAITIRAGTSGYSYKEWRGRFYPPEVPQDEWLDYYASRLPTVEINNTFYRMPRSHVMETWRDSVPDAFRFVIKASRRITHQKRLNDAAEPLRYLLGGTAILGSKLGALLFQLPPYMRVDLDRLKTFQALLPDDLPVAFEFRHDSWNDPAVNEALAGRGHARVVSHETGDTAEEVLPGPLVYLRLRAPSYTDAELSGWQAQIRGSGAENAYVFFKHEDEAGGPEMAERFLSLATRPAVPAPKRAARRGGAEPATGSPRAASEAAPKAAAPKAAARKAPASRVGKRR